MLLTTFAPTCATVIGGQPDYVLPSPWQILEACVNERDLLVPAALRTGFAAIVGFVTAVAGGSIIALMTWRLSLGGIDLYNDDQMTMMLP